MEDHMVYVGGLFSVVIYRNTLRIGNFFDRRQSISENAYPIQLQSHRAREQHLRRLAMGRMSYVMPRHLVKSPSKGIR